MKIGKVILLQRSSEGKSIYYKINFNPDTISLRLDVPSGRWKKLIDTSSEEWLGPGASIEKYLLGKAQNIVICSV